MRTGGTEGLFQLQSEVNKLSCIIIGQLGDSLGKQTYRHVECIQREISWMGKVHKGSVTFHIIHFYAIIIIMLLTLSVHSLW